ncbi:MAG: UDP-N-acetylmuramoyl-L-alanyl-D-glutamate--2,6-diaminopimelate ligase [Tessaracoccus sp.]
MAAAIGVTAEVPVQRVSGITADSRVVEHDWLYVALHGAHTHGARFAGQAVADGAVAVLTDAEGAGVVGTLPVPILAVSDVRSAMAEASALIFARPSERLTMLGVTGTNGKTTTVALLQAGLAAAGRRAGSIGTIGFRLGDDTLVSGRSTVTTPDSPDLQALLATMAERGADAVALEVSSHALALQRVDAIAFDVVGFLNLGRDHLDFHRDVQDYFEAKARLFEPGRAAKAVIWVDDEAGREILGRIRSTESMEAITVGTSDNADYRLGEVRALGRTGGSAEVVARGQRITLDIALPGRYNMIDALIALAMLEAVGIARSDVLTGLATAQVPGRMESVALEGAEAPLVVVDFAHTPQAVAAALQALRGKGQLIAVLGCGGDRDADKRPLMGAAAAEGSDVVIVTDDNPRSEDPGAIRAAVREGARAAAQRSGATVLEVAGRGAAIQEALRRAEGDTVVAVLGKGHERGQILADRIIDFDDRIEVRKAWRELDLSHSQGGGDDDA